jgi:hypothetical protein
MCLYNVLVVLKTKTTTEVLAAPGLGMEAWTTWAVADEEHAARKVYEHNAEIRGTNSVVRSWWSDDVTSMTEVLKLFRAFRDRSMETVQLSPCD